jgi:RNA polymerase sigma factor (sigma-70 family)
VASPSFLSSEGLVKACIGKDNEAAWAEFIRRFQPLIARVVWRVARRHSAQVPSHLIDDLVQDTYLKLCADECRLLRQFESRHRDSIFAFLKVVATRVVFDHFKSELARKRDASQTDALSGPGPQDTPDRSQAHGLSMEDKVAVRQIDDILKTLYTGDILARNRAIFWLHHREGMTAQAISSIPGLELNTKGVETALRRMKQLIQGHIGISS